MALMYAAVTAGASNGTIRARHDGKDHAASTLPALAATSYAREAARKSFSTRLSFGRTTD